MKRDVMMRLYHSRRAIFASSLVSTGFGAGSQIVEGYGARGYFVSDTSQPRGQDHIVLAIDWDGTDEELDQYAYNRHQWRPHGNPYREWHIPGPRLNRCRRSIVAGHALLIRASTT